MENNINNFLFKDISTIKGVGKKLKLYLKKKNIEKVKDLLFDLPYEIVDRTKISSLDKLEIGHDFYAMHVRRGDYVSDASARKIFNIIHSCF